MIGDMFVNGLAAGAYVLGLLFVLTMFALTVYAICCAFAWAFGGEGEEAASSGALAPPSHEGEGSERAADAAKKTWEEIEVRYQMKP